MFMRCEEENYNNWKFFFYFEVYLGFLYLKSNEYIFTDSEKTKKMCRCFEVMRIDCKIDVCEARLRLCVEILSTYPCPTNWSRGPSSRWRGRVLNLWFNNDFHT